MMNPLKDLPKTQRQEILYLLLTNKNISCLTVPYMHGYRTRVSELSLKYKLDISYKIKKGVNKFGNTYKYHEHTLKSKEQGVKIYLEMLSKNK